MLSRPRLLVSSGIAFGIPSLLTGCSAESFPIGAAGRVFPDATKYIFQSSAELMITSSSRASMVSTDTVFGVARAVAQFEA